MRPTYGGASWLFLRLLGVIYFVAFWSLAVQIVGLVGHDGILPAPTWASDSVLRALCYGGAALAILLTIGIAPIPVLVALWLGYLTLSTVCVEFLSYQWDALLLETGLIAVFLAPAVLRERADRLADPPRVARALMLWLLFRLMVGSGAVKLASGDPTWRSLTALSFHYETQPIPTPLAWYAHRLPLWFDQASTFAVFVIELAAPWSMLTSSRAWRLAGFVSLVGLQALIAFTGNYAFFNLLSAALCLFLLDDETIASLFRRPGPPGPGTDGTDHMPAGRTGPALRIRQVATIVFAVVTVPVSLAMFVSSFGILFAPPPVAALADLIAPLRSVNGYGLFAVMTTARDEIVVEGSNDRVTWQAYEFQYKPGDLRRAPPWVAPHQPRLDWQMWFASLTTFENASWFGNFCVRLLQGSPDVSKLLARNPFPDHPPRYLRAVVYRYRFGRDDWWTRERVGDYSPVLTLH